MVSAVSHVRLLPFIVRSGEEVLDFIFDAEKEAPAKNTYAGYYAYQGLDYQAAGTGIDIAEKLKQAESFRFTSGN
jgi:hypothetical protein